MIQTDWEEFREISIEDYKVLMNKTIIFEGRRTYDPDLLLSEGIQYYGIGWKNI